MSERVLAASRLCPTQRQRDLDRLRTERFDVVVIGGGVVGAGAALDAATRGLRVALVEGRDWAAGTSSRSSKLIHGGLRYLEQRDFTLVREALRERALLLGTIAPHLVWPVPFLLPLRHRWQRAYYGAGLLLYDTMGSALGRLRGLPRHRHLSREQALELFPSLAPDGLTGALRYFDAQVDDARHTLTLARTAAAYGAAAVSSARATGFVRVGDAVAGVHVRDVETGEDLVVRARAVVAATGVWSDDIGAMIGASAGLRVRASKGVHLVVPRDRIDGAAGLILRTPTSVLFVIPWRRHWLIGTTDTDWDLDRAHPVASARDVSYLLAQVNRALVRPLQTDDIEGVYAGLRPLLAGESDATSQLSREHAVVTPLPGLVLIAGGKYTTYRVMARDAIDRAAPHAPRSRTHRVPLLGADGYREAVAWRERTARESGLPVSYIDHLLRRYGSLLTDLLALVADRPELAAPVPGAPGYRAVEIVYAAQAEGVLHLDDVLARRTRISIEVFDRGLAAAEPVARLVAPVLGWDEDVIADEVGHYHARVAAERESQRQPDDRTADAARLDAPDVRGAR